MQNKGKKRIFKTNILILLLITFLIFVSYALSTSWYTNSVSQFDLGTYNFTEYNVSYNLLQLTTNGSLRELPNNQILKVYDEGFDNIQINMSGNVLLLHLDDKVGCSNILDSSGQGHNGTANTGAKCGIAGKMNNASNFSGTAVGYINVTDAPDLRLTSAITLSAWVKRKISTSEGAIIIKGAGGVGGYFFSVGSIGCAANEIDVTKFGVVAICLGSFPADSAWHHLVMSGGSSGVFVYIDGALSGNSNDTQNWISYTGPLQIGGESSANQFSFSGSIDEVAVWNRSLSASEINYTYILQKDKFRKKGEWTSQVFDSGVVSGAEWHNITVTNTSLSSSDTSFNITVRSCDDASCVGENWNTTFTSFPINLSQPKNRYLQYLIKSHTSNRSFSPLINNVTINYVVNNWVCDDASLCAYQELYKCFDAVNGTGSFACTLNLANRTYYLGNSSYDRWTLTQTASIEYVSQASNTNFTMDCQGKGFYDTTDIDNFRRLPANFNFKNCIFWAYPNSTVFDFSGEPVAKVYMSNNTFYGYGATDDYTIIGGTNFNFTNNTLWGASLSCDNCYVVNNTFLNSTNTEAAFKLAGNQQDSTVEKNRFINNSATGLRIVASPKEVSNNYFERNKGAGIWVAAGTTEFTIYNNTFVDNANLTYGKTLSASKQDIVFNSSTFDTQVVILDFYYILTYPIDISKLIHENNTGVIANDTYFENYAFALWYDESNIFLTDIPGYYQIFASNTSLAKENITNCDSLERWMNMTIDNICNLLGGVFCNKDGGVCHTFEEKALIYNPTFTNFSWNVSSPFLTGITPVPQFWINDNWAQTFNQADIHVDILSNNGTIRNNVFTSNNKSSFRVGLDVGSTLTYNLSIYNNHFRYSHLESLSSNNLCINGVGNFYGQPASSHHFLGDCGYTNFTKPNKNENQIYGNFYSLKWKEQASLFPITYEIYLKNQTNESYNFFLSSTNLSYYWNIQSLAYDLNYTLKIIRYDTEVNTTDEYVSFFRRINEPDYKDLFMSIILSFLAVVGILIYLAKNVNKTLQFYSAMTISLALYFLASVLSVAIVMVGQKNFTLIQSSAIIDNLSYIYEGILIASYFFITIFFLFFVVEILMWFHKRLTRWGKKGEQQ